MFHFEDIVCFKEPHPEATECEKAARYRGEPVPFSRMCFVSAHWAFSRHRGLAFKRKCFSLAGSKIQGNRFDPQIHPPKHVDPGSQGSCLPVKL